jgi:hypothetical protein
MRNQSALLISVITGYIFYEEVDFADSEDVIEVGTDTSRAQGFERLYPYQAYRVCIIE